MRHSTPPAIDESWPPRRLTVVYDDSCELCLRCAAWLADQPTHVELRFLASGDPEVFERYGDLPWFRIELMVVTDTGLAWVGGPAFTMCLWATVRWRPMAQRLGGRRLAPVAERFFHAVSSNRSTVSGMLRPSDCSSGTCAHHPPAPPTTAPPPPRADARVF